MLHPYLRVLLVVVLTAAAAIDGRPAHAQSGWSRIGVAEVDLASEVVSIAIDGGSAGTAVRLEARQGGARLSAVVVTFGKGRVHLEERPIVLQPGERTRPIVLAAAEEPVRSIEVVLAPGGSGRATLEVWAQRAERPEARVPATAPQEVLFSRPEAAADLPVNAIGLRPSGVNQRFQSIRIVPEPGARPLQNVLVHYPFGAPDEFDATRLRRGPDGYVVDRVRDAQVTSIWLVLAPPDQPAAPARSGPDGADAAAGRTPAGGYVVFGTLVAPVAPPIAKTASKAERKSDDGGSFGTRVVLEGILRAQRRSMGGAQPRSSSGGHVSGVPVDRTTGPSEPAPTTRAVQPGAPPAASDGQPVSRTSYSYNLEFLDACVTAKTCTPVPVFFGTDRNQIDAGGAIAFGPERAGRVQLGRVYVTVPSKNRQAGELNLPGTLDWIRGTPAGGDPSRHFTIPKAGIALFKDADELIAAVKAHVASGLGTHKDHAFVYVHGYRVPWHFAAMRTAQIAYDLSPDDAPFGTPFLYSWPSQGAAADYITDLENSRIAIPHLVSFLRMVAERTGASHVHVIAHSMGNFPVMHALAEIARTAPDVKFSQVILAAPDVEKREFEDVARQVVKVAKGVTLYASSSDIALLVSRLLRRDKPRAGDAKDPPGPSVVDGMDTVDISRLATGFMSYFSWNHDKYADSPVLLNDISTLFRKGDRPPSSRNVSFRLHQAGLWRYRD